MRVDVHTHFIPDSYRELLDEIGKPVRITQRDDRRVIAHNHGELPFSPGFHDMDARIEWMEEFDIDRCLVSISTPSPDEGPFTVEESTRLSRAINDGFADLQSAYPDHVAGLGVLPLRDEDAALDELDRIAGELDLAGVGLRTRAHGRPWTDPALEPVFDRLDELGLAAFLHPLPNELSDALPPEEWMVNPNAIFPTDTTVNICRYIFAGFFDRHDFPLVLSHLGGAIPYLVGRWEHHRTQSDQYRVEGPQATIYDYVERFYYDSITFHRPALKMAIETVGTDHLVFGTDYPYPSEHAAATIADLDAMDFSESEYDAVMGGTAAELFDL